MIYLDNAATQEVLPNVLFDVNNALRNYWGNPSSVYKIGRDSKNIIESARETVANYIGAEPNEIIFTSGACEANSLALNGYGTLITTKIEHKSIMMFADYIKKVGTCFYVDVNNDGTVNIDSLKIMVRASLHQYFQPILSVQYANNEIGTIQNIKEITKIAKEINPDIVVHTDATQIMANRSIDVKNLGVDMLSFSGQKIGATKGIGVLYVKDSTFIKPLIYGSQENGRRGGTENVPYIYGLERAIKILDKSIVSISYYNLDIKSYFLDKLKESELDYYIVGNSKDSLNNLVAICFPNTHAQELMALLEGDDIYVGSGSACNSGTSEQSYVLKAIGMNNEDSDCVIRFSFNNKISKNDIDVVVDTISKHVKNLKLFGI